MGVVCLTDTFAFEIFHCFFVTGCSFRDHHLSRAVSHREGAEPLWLEMRRKNEPQTPPLPVALPENLGYWMEKALSPVVEFSSLLNFG